MVIAFYPKVCFSKNLKLYFFSIEQITQECLNKFQKIITYGKQDIITKQKSMHSKNQKQHLLKHLNWFPLTFEIKKQKLFINGYIRYKKIYEYLQRKINKIIVVNVLPLEWRKYIHTYIYLYIKMRYNTNRR